MGDADLQHAITAAIHRYSRAMDERDWALMDEVFTVDAVADFGGAVLEGRAAVVRFIRAAIECCERTQMDFWFDASRPGDVAKFFAAAFAPV